MSENTYDCWDNVEGCWYIATESAVEYQMLEADVWDKLGTFEFEDMSLLICHSMLCDVIPLVFIAISGPEAAIETFKQRFDVAVSCRERANTIAQAFRRNNAIANDAYNTLYYDLHLRN